ncbi:MAG: TonB-system energizer ExbB [Sutterella wadsworthensis]
MEWMKEAVDYVIFGILGLMGFVALWLMIERMLFLKRYRPGDYASEEERGIALTKNFTTLYIIYSNAPYVGLLGTVIGIMLTFYDMGSTGAIDAGRIMTGLSLALKATALGLAVAIPTLISYNGLQRAINVASRRRA